MPDWLKAPWVQLLLAVGILAVTGALAGVIWEWVWTPSIGVVLDHEWIPVSETSMSEQFSATGWYVVVGTVAGLVGGAIAALLLYRAPILTLVGVTIGAVLGAYLMYVVGVARGPADHHELARTAAEGTRLPRALSVSGASPWLALPVGALIAVAVVFLVGALLISVAGAAVEPADNQEPVA